MFKLLIEDDEGGKKVVPIIRDEITIGRQEGNTIRLTERNVSRHHGRLVRENGRLYIEELSARYGLKKNGKRISQREEFREGDVVLIGDYRLTVQLDKKAQVGPPGAARSGDGGFSHASTQITNLADMQGAPRERTAVMPAMPAKLVVISSNFAGQEFPLNRQEMVIGRGEDCHIIIDHRSISTRHAKIVREDNTTYKIVDLNSKNGVKVSGEDYRATHLKRGDVVELGHVKFRFVEPGENYVFTPQPAGAATDDFAPLVVKSGPNIGVIVGALVVVLVLIGGVVFMMSSGGDTPEPGTTDLLASDSNAVAATGPAAAAGAAAPESDDRVASALEKARAEIAEGQLQRAIGTLESARDLLDPAPDQLNEISELLSQARNEQPFQRAHAAATELLKDGKHLEALRRIATIPSHSLFHQVVQDEKLAREALEGATAAAQKDFDAGNVAEARNQIDEILAFDANFGPANQLLGRIEQRESQARMVAQRPTNTASDASNRTARPASTGGASTRKSTGAAKRPPVDAAQARELFTSAARKVASGDPRGAIADCQEGLRGGHLACHRILGVAYGQINDNSRACQHYQQYLRTGPANASSIESQMQKIGCGS